MVTTLLNFNAPMEREYLFQSAPNLQAVKIFVLYSRFSN